MGILTDIDKVLVSCREAYREREIDDATARVIGSIWHNGQASQSYLFASTGAILDPTSLYQELFPYYDAMPGEEQLIADMMGTYLTAAGPRANVEGWSKLWV